MRILFRLFALLALLLNVAVHAAGPDSGATVPDDPRSAALRDFDFIVTGLRQDYAGFPDKAAGTRLAEFEADVAERRARVAASPDAFPEQIWSLLGWFKDGHLGLETVILPPSGVAAAGATADDRQLAAQGRFIPVDAANLRRKTRLPEMQGIWQTLDGTYEVAVVADRERAGLLLGVVTASKAASWAPGQVKFELERDRKGGWQGTLRMRDHTERVGPVRTRFDGSYVLFEATGTIWQRTWPAPTIARDRVLPSTEFFLKPLSPQTLWLRLPDFANANRTTIENLLADNRALLERTPNLLIDLRDNHGGSDASYRELMRWIYSRPIYTVGVEFRSSPVNAQLYAKALENPDFPPQFRPLLIRLIDQMRANPGGGWVRPDDKLFSIDVMPEVRPFPKRVAIIGTGAGSSGDQFVLDAQQSRKVTTFGGPTAGVIDYSNQLERLTPSGRYLFKWPTSRSMRLPELPLDNIGVPADLPIPDDADPIGFVQTWLERQVD